MCKAAAGMGGERESGGVDLVFPSVCGSGLLRGRGVRVSMEKYLICRPEGGLTDMLSQIGLCRAYCLRHGRTLVIDTEHSQTFAAPFGLFFSLDDPGLRVVADAGSFIRRARAEGLSVHPDHVRLDPSREQQPRYVEKMNFCIDGKQTTFDFASDHEAAVLIHQQCGREPFDFEFMARLRLSPGMRRLIERRWAALPKPYIGVHVRNTDIKSEIDGLAPLIGRYRGAVFLATDSAAVQRRAREITGRRVFKSPIPDFGGRSLHTRPVSREVKRRLNTLAIADLVLLALSKRVYVATEASGYSLLAQALNRDRGVVAAWMGRDLASVSRPWSRGVHLAWGTLAGLRARCAGRR